VKKKIKPVSLTSKRQAMTAPLSAAQETTIRFTVDLPESLHRKLSILAAQQGRKKAGLVREWMQRELQDVEG
jgi:predicted DNA-binding protein